MSKLANDDIRRAALNLLARREHSTFELSRKLRLKGYDPAAIQPIILSLTENSLLSDVRFTESYTHMRQRKGYGPLRIRLELIERGITEDIIEHQLNIADNAWFARARAAWQKRFKGKLPQDFKTRAQQMRFLQYRGFSQEHIETIFSDP